MNFTTHFHTNYTSNGVGSTHTKVSIEIDGFGMFCVIRNKNTGTIQRQSYMPGRYNTKNYIGLSCNGYFNGVDSLKQAWSGIDDGDKNSIVDCVNNHLVSGFRRFVKKYNEMSNTTPNVAPLNVNEVCDYLRALIRQMNGNAPIIPDGADSTTTVGTVSEFTSMNWGEVKLASLSSNDLQSIMEMINDKNNPEEGVEYNGNTYRVMNDDSGRMVLRMLHGNDAFMSGKDCHVNDNEKQPKPVATTPQKPMRRTKRMAFMTNNENLTEFVNGCYYKFVKELNADFITILNDANEERTVSRSRVSLLDVYDQPPFEEVMS